MDLITGEGFDPMDKATGKPAEITLPWEEKYRGHDFDSIILPSSIRSAVETAVSMNSFGNYVLYSGKPGTGKTSLARAIPEMLGTESRFLYGKRDAEILAEIEEYSMHKIIDGKPRFVIIDEADKARNPKTFYRDLQSTIEATSNTLRFILTCNDLYRIPEPIISRCYPIEFKTASDDETKDLKNRIYKRLLHIAQSETALSGGTVDKNTIVDTIAKCYPDIRKMICTLHHCFLMNGGSISGVAPVISGENIEKLFEFVKSKSAKQLRYYISNYISDPLGVYVPFTEYAVEHIPEAGLIEYGAMVANAMHVAKGQVDQEIMLWGFLCRVSALVDRLAAKGMTCV